MNKTLCTLLWSVRTNIHKYTCVLLKMMFYIVCPYSLTYAFSLLLYFTGNIQILTFTTDWREFTHRPKTVWDVSSQRTLQIKWISFFPTIQLRLGIKTYLWMSTKSQRNKLISTQPCEQQACAGAEYTHLLILRLT